MKKVTISLPDELYERARIAAAERSTTLTAWVRELIADTVNAKSGLENRKRLQNEAIAPIQSFDASDRLSRDELHGR